MTETITVDETSSLYSIIQLFGGTQQEQKNSLAKVNIDITDDFTSVDEIYEDYYSRNIAALAMVLANNDDIINYNKSYVQRAIERINEVVEEQVNSILKHPEFRYLENQWLKLEELVKDEYDNIEVTLLDVKKEELQYDFERNMYDISSSEMFKKVYVAEYDQYGGEPYAY